MRMVRWMCGVNLKDRLPGKELSERLGIDDIALVLQQNRLHWYGHVLQKDDDDWVKKCMKLRVQDQEEDQRGPGERLSERTVKLDTIRDTILTCARKPTQVSLIYRTEPTTKKV